jgi:hypothetical protein
MTKVIQIVPRLPPNTDGIGDYALNLGHELKRAYGIETNFIVGDSEWNGGKEVGGFITRKIHSSGSLLAFLLNDPRGEQLQANPIILLHYVGYGYAKRGCPFWLVEGLKSCKKKMPQMRLVTMFHELYAFGPPWTSAS